MDFTREDCLDYVFHKLQEGDTEMLVLFEIIAQKHEWISIDIYKEVAEIFYQRLKQERNG